MKPFKMQRPIFHARPTNVKPLLITEVEEHFFACRKMSKNNARQYMYSVNLDYDSVVSFIKTIKNLEKCFYDHE
jgi:hypothetical protein